MFGKEKMQKIKIKLRGFNFNRINLLSVKIINSVLKIKVLQRYLGLLKFLKLLQITYHPLQ